MPTNQNVRIVNERETTKQVLIIEHSFPKEKKKKKKLTKPSTQQNIRTDQYEFE